MQGQPWRDRCVTCEKSSIPSSYCCGTDCRHAGVAAWGVKLQDVEGRGEKLSETIKLAGLTELCPPEVQEIVIQKPGENGMYKTMKDNIVSWFSNKVAMTDEPTPKAVGRVDEQFEKCSEFGEHMGVDAVGSMQRPGCGGWGHMRRDCPSQKGYGSKGKGKDRSNAGAKGGSCNKSARQRL